METFGFLTIYYFMVKKNDGWFDAGLYRDPNKPRLNPYFSLFSDTAYYFLTWNSQLQNSRFKPSTNKNFASKTSQSYFLAQSTSPFTSQYSVGEKDGAGVASPLFDQGEGWASPNHCSSFCTFYLFVNPEYLSING